MEQLLEQEQNHLDELMHIFKDKIDSLEENINKQISLLDGSDDIKRHIIIDNYHQELEKYKERLTNPYFGKFTFKTDDKVYNIYIGNKNISSNNNQITYDWRNKICSVFYDYEIGNASYIDNKNIITGELLSKELFDIKNGKLTIIDKMPSNKPLYTKITPEQNKIIRNKLSHNTIVIGDNNTGKTTTLLHRLSYLLYTDSSNINEKNVIIINNDKDYLSNNKDYLKELNIDKVANVTFDEIALKTIKKIKRSELSNDNLDTNITKYKNSFDYLKALEKYVDTFIIKHLEKPIVFENIVLSSVDRLSSIYRKSMMHTDPYADRINAFTKKTSKMIKEASDDYRFRAWSKYREEIKSLKDNDPRRKEIIDITKKNDQEINSGCINIIKEYFSFLKTSPVTLYQEFIEKIEDYMDNLPEELEYFKKETIDNINNKKINSYDLAAIMYINYLINGININDDYKYIFIDDIDKFSETQIFMLKKMYPKAIFNTFGKNKSNVLSDLKVDCFGLNKVFDKEEIKAENLPVENKIEKEPFEEVKIEIEKTQIENNIEKEKYEEPILEVFRKINIVPVYAIKELDVLIIDDNNLLATGEYEIKEEILEKLTKNNKIIHSSELILDKPKQLIK